MVWHAGEASLTAALTNHQLPLKLKMSILLENMLKILQKFYPKFWCHVKNMELIPEIIGSNNLFKKVY